MPAYIEDVLNWLGERERIFRNAKNDLIEYERREDRYTPAAKTALLASIKTALNAQPAMPERSLFTGERRPPPPDGGI